MKKILVVLVLLLTLNVTLFAVDNTSSEGLGILIGNNRTAEESTKNKLTENYFSGPLQFFLTIICGSVGGSLVLFKFASEIFFAVTRSADDPNVYKKIITTFVVHLLIVSLGVGGIYVVMGVVV